ncbi:phage terminase small subunit-related protein [Bacillus spizizenii ATCC 6633 = JCM 2499]|nr:hypothetical protein [Bacillus spizizenii]MDR4203386.1 hypothetical protein [Bacillus spizizenii ATCC 6633 = JCM 2499]QCJ17756.1 hypothetical protein FA024_11670 [Bacillus subtilis]MBT3128096.1 hypothetical protein [Bacillus spizizenii]QCY17993.1 hypothetical protein EO946_13190 [Bacillus spizizenii ATCC 6633 = JCM 2499]
MPKPRNPCRDEAFLLWEETNMTSYFLDQLSYS